MIQDLETNNPKKIKDKVKESLMQTTRDLEVFLKIFPDLTKEELDRITFNTMSILPATLSEKIDICSNCQHSIVFREDVYSEIKENGSIAEFLNSAMSQSPMPESLQKLKQKLGVCNETTIASRESLNLLRLISSRLVGVGSLYFPKTYGPNKTFFEATANMIDEVKKFSIKDLEKALYLSPEQVQAMNRFKFFVTGFYGTGKTTALEVAIDKIVQKSEDMSEPKILFVTWDECSELADYFKAKFKKIKEKQYPNLSKDDSLEVLDLTEVCIKYGITSPYEQKTSPLQSLQRHTGIEDKYSFLDMRRRKRKVDFLNDLCKKLKGKD